MLSNVELTLVSPADQDEMRGYQDVMAFLFKFIPTTLSASAAWLYVLDSVPHVTIAYANGVPIGFFLLEVYNHSVELHGVVRPDIKTIVPHSSRFKNYIYSIIFDGVFNTMGKSSVVIKAPETNRDVFGFAAMHGFKRLKYKDKGETVWVLYKRDYQARQRDLNVERQSTEG